MLVRRLSQWVSPAILALAIVAFAGFSDGSVAQAQWRYCDNNRNSHQSREREALRRHQLRERYTYGDSYAVRYHQQREREELNRHQRFERIRDLNGYGNGYGRFNGYGRSSNCRRRY